MYIRILFFALLFLGYSWVKPSYAQAPTLINFQAQVQLDPEPEGDVPVIFRMYTEREGGDSVWEETQQLPLQNNLIRALVGEATSFPNDFFLQHDILFLQLTVDGNELEERFQLVPVPYASRALVSDRSLSAPKLTKTYRDTLNSLFLYEGSVPRVISEFLLEDVPEGNAAIYLTLTAKLSQEGKTSLGEIQLRANNELIDSIYSHHIGLDFRQIALHGIFPDFGGGDIVIQLFMTGQADMSSTNSIEFGVRNDSRFGRRLTVIAGL